MHSSFQTIAIRLAILLIVSAPATAASPWSISTGIESATAVYDGADYEYVYVPFTGEYQAGPYAAWITLPFWYYAVETQDAATSYEARELGDVRVGIQYYLPQPGIAGSYVRLSAELIIGSGSDSGTASGESGVLLQVDGYRSFDRFTPFASLGYDMPGDGADATRWEDGVYGTAGLERTLGNDVNAGLYLYYREPYLADRSPVRELTAYINHRLGPASSIEIFAFRGFTDASAIRGIGFAYARNFELPF